MARVSQSRIQQCFLLSENGQTSTEQGRSLEDLICYLFERIPGISMTTRNRLNFFNSQEIDVAFWNEKNRRGLYFLPNIILVECKNWSAAVGSMEVNWFDTKVKNSGLTFGVLVAANGITGNAQDLTSAHKIVADALKEQRQLIVVTRQEIETITDTVEVIRLFKQKLCELAVAGTTLP